jgi:peptidoglycan/LPS O-acetylase OafA/YrhL
MTRTAAERLDYLDALRGLATIAVIVYHTAIIPATKVVLPAWLAPIVLNGGSGAVTLFFMISVFALLHISRSYPGEPHAKSRFFIRRLCRIMPLYYSWLILSLAWPSGAAVTPLELLASSTFTFNLIPGTQWSVVPGGWTLGVEMIFYLLFPLLLSLVFNLRRAVIFLLVAAAVALTHYFGIRRLALSPSIDLGEYIIYISFFHQLPVFALGVLSYFICGRLAAASIAKPRRYGAALLAVGAAGSVLLSFSTQGPMFLYLFAATFSCVMIGLSLYPMKVLVNRATVFLGVISYSLYLNHPRLIYYCDWLYQRIHAAVGDPTLGFFACALVTLVPLILVSHVTYRMIEKPGIALGRKLSERLSTREHTVAMVNEYGVK